MAAELKSQRRPIIVGLACTLVTSVLYASIVGLVKLATNAVELLAKSSDPSLTNHEAVRASGMQQLVLGCVLVIVVFGARYWFTRGQTYFLSEAANRLAADLRTRMFSKLLRMPVSYFNDRRAGTIQSILTNDVNVYQNAVGIIRDSIDGPIKAAAAFIFVFAIRWQLGLMALLLIPIMGAIIQRNSARMKAAQAQVQEDLGEVGATTLEVLQGTRVVKAFGVEDRVERQYADLVEQSFKSQMGAVAIVAALRPLVELIGAVALAAVFYIGGRLAARGELQVSDIAAIATAMDVINQGFRSLGNVSNTYAGVQAASDRIYGEILSIPDAHEATGAKTLPSPRGRIEFKQVSFVYPDGTQALDRVSFEIDSGSSLALVGPSGAGKSTIADLLLRFYDPTEGQILFDGVDLRELNVAWLRAQIGVVPQNTFLFAGSIEENVRLGNVGASDADIKEALCSAHAEEFTREMAQRSTTELGERGIKLSGGQMQRIAIARALVRKPTVLLLDEATSALDASSERAVTEALDEIMKGRSTLFIAHRLTTAARADRILYLRRGEVVETGSHRELMDANGEYAALFRVFSGGVLDEGLA